MRALSIERLVPIATRALPELPAGQSVLAYAVLTDGSLAIVSDDQDLVKVASQRAQHPKLFRERAAIARAQLWTLEGDTLQFQFAFQLESPFVEVGRLPDGRWLIVAARTAAIANARLYAPHGELVSRFMLGDAIEALRIDPTGGIWVGWFDEGLGQDWPVPGRDWPPSAGGIACFDEAGQVLWEPDAGHHFECAGLNLCGDEIWMLNWSEERVCRFGRSHRYQAWVVDLPLVSALAVDGKHVLTAGGRGADLDVVLVKLGSDKGQVIAKGTLDAPIATIQSTWKVDGSGDRLHWIGGGEWRQWTVADALRQVHACAPIPLQATVDDGHRE